MPRFCTFLLAPALFAGGFVGPEACAPCHRTEYDKQIRSHHALALRRIAEVPQAVCAACPHNLNAALEWAFGAGAQGITPVGVYQGRYFENRFSYYPAAGRFDVTFGHPTHAAQFGILLDGRTISECFNCHATGVQVSSTGPDLSAMRAGITCERCHGPGAAHIAAAKAGAPAAEIRRALLNPGRLPAAAEVQICGQCHRLPDADSGPEPEIQNPVAVRFAPVGLMASRCFQSSKTLRCTTCHDPHDNARPRSDVAYTTACLGCHAIRAKCPHPAKTDCVSCHMPRAGLGPYLHFTNHRIQVN